MCQNCGFDTLSRKMTSKKCHNYLLIDIEKWRLFIIKLLSYFVDFCNNCYWNNLKIMLTDCLYNGHMCRKCEDNLVKRRDCHLLSSLYYKYCSIKRTGLYFSRMSLLNVPDNLNVCLSEVKRPVSIKRPGQNFF